MTHYLTDPFRQPREEAMTEPTPSTADQFASAIADALHRPTALEDIFTAPEHTAHDDLDLEARITADTKENNR